MKIKYTIKEVHPNIFAVSIPDAFHRAMVFMRTQEFYESKDSKVRGKFVTFFEYFEKYSRRNGNAFTYAADWAGYNFPLSIALQWSDLLTATDDETPYDIVFESIVYTIWNKAQDRDRAYIIGVDTIDKKNWLFQHELCHGLYLAEPEYKKAQDEVTRTALTKKQRKALGDRLKKMGYMRKVERDEIQAYFSTEWNNEYLRTALPAAKRKQLHNLYKANFKKYHGSVA